MINQFQGQGAIFNGELFFSFPGFRNNLILYN